MGGLELHRPTTAPRPPVVSNLPNLENPHVSCVPKRIGGTTLIVAPAYNNSLHKILLYAPQRWLESPREASGLSGKFTASLFIEAFAVGPPKPT